MKKLETTLRFEFVQSREKAREEERHIVTGKSSDSMHDSLTSRDSGLHFDMQMNHTCGARTSGPSYISNARERRIEFC